MGMNWKKFSKIMIYCLPHDMACLALFGKINDAELLLMLNYDIFHYLIILIF